MIDIRYIVSFQEKVSISMVKACPSRYLGFTIAQYANDGIQLHVEYYRDASYISLLLATSTALR